MFKHLHFIAINTTWLTNEKIIKFWWHKFKKSFIKVLVSFIISMQQLNKKKQKLISEHNSTRLTMKTHLTISNYW